MLTGRAGPLRQIQLKVMKLGPGHHSDWRQLKHCQDSQTGVCACVSKRRAGGAPLPAILQGFRIGAGVQRVGRLGLEPRTGG